MKAAHLISDELFTQAMEEIQKGNEFIAYNGTTYLLDKGDMEFFTSMADAKEYAFNNHSDRDEFYTMKASSVMDIYDHFEIVQALMENPQLLSQFKLTNMEENNYEYLAKQLKWVGLGEKPLEELKNKMESGEAILAIFQKTSYGNDKADIRLDFKKSEDKDMYFFNSYTMKLAIAGQEGEIAQKFYINNKQDNITIKEAYNMLSGRAIEKEITPKEGEKYMAWLQLDFKETDTNGQYKTKQFHPNYGFDLEKVLDRHPLRELETIDGKKQLMESLQRGNRQSVTLEAEGKDIKLFIEAAPQFKSLNYYDSNMKRVNSHELVPGEKKAEGEKQAAGEKQDKKNNVKQGGDDDIDKRKQGRKVKQGM
jgi:hypothetical protein